MENVKSYDAFNYHWRVWKLFGIKKPQKFRLLYIIYAIFINTTVTVLFPVTLIVNCFFSTNLDDLSENFTITITDVISNLKFLNIFILRSKLIMIKDVTEELDNHAKSEKEKRIIKNSVQVSCNVFSLFLYMYSAACITSQLTFIMAKENQLMYPAWFPLDWKNSNRNFYIVHCYQTFGLFVQAIQDVANDSYPPALLNLISGHVKVLIHKFDKLGFNPKNSQEQTYEELIACIKDHLLILKLHDTVQDTISTACLAQFVCSGIVQCTIGIYILNQGNYYSRLMNMTLFFVAVTFEILLLCYFGDQLMSDYNELRESIYRCNWVEQDHKFKKALIILMQRCNKPIKISAGNIFPVSLATFVQVMKSAYSLFAVLREV